VGRASHGEGTHSGALDGCEEDDDALGCCSEIEQREWVEWMRKEMAILSARWRGRRWLGSGEFGR
jgi:hypothetical protein